MAQEQLAAAVVVVVAMAAKTIQVPDVVDRNQNVVATKLDRSPTDGNINHNRITAVTLLNEIVNNLLHHTHMVYNLVPPALQCNLTLLDPNAVTTMTIANVIVR